jgi:hypothetical protein
MELRALADRLLDHDPIAVEWCVTFVEAETCGIGHGRARARMARRRKHCPLSKNQTSSLVQAILNRLVHGGFSEQFKDQLRLAIQLDPQETFAAARNCQNAAADHVSRYARWILAHETLGDLD